jgi:hypothetical protein
MAFDLAQKSSISESTIPPFDGFFTAFDRFLPGNSRIMAQAVKSRYFQVTKKTKTATTSS